MLFMKYGKLISKFIQKNKKVIANILQRKQSKKELVLLDIKTYFTIIIDMILIM